MITVSIIIPFYNRIDLIKATLHSVQVQTYSHWEAIVVDDGSTDGSYESVQQIAQQDQRIKLLKRMREPKGGSSCRNIGAKESKGEFLIFLDSDDLLAPFCLEQRLKYFQQFPDQDFLIFPMLLFHAQPYDMLQLWNVATHEDDLARFLRADGVWQTSCPIYRKEAFLRSGGFDEALPFWQDYEFHTRLLIQNFQYLKLFDTKPDCFNRRHTQASISQEGLRAKEHLLLKEQVYIELINRLKANQKIDKEKERAVVAMFYSFAIKWVVGEQDISKALSIWQTGYEQDVIDTFHFSTGSFCLLLKYLQLKAKKGNTFFSFVYKGLNSTLLRKLKYPEPDKSYKEKSSLS